MTACLQNAQKLSQIHLSLKIVKIEKNVKTHVATNAHQGTECDSTRYHFNLLHLIEDTEGVVHPLGMSGDIYQGTEEDLRGTEANATVP